MKIVLIVLLFFMPCGILLGAKGDHIVAKHRTSLESISIPLVDFEDRTIREAVDFVWSRAVELNTLETDPKKKGISILIRYPSGELYPKWGARNPDRPAEPKGIKIRYRARNVTVCDLLIEIAKIARFDLYTTSVGVVFCPPGTYPFPNANAKNGDTWEQLYKVPHFHRSATKR